MTTLHSSELSRINLAIQLGVVQDEYLRHWQTILSLPPSFLPSLMALCIKLLPYPIERLMPL